MRVSIKEILKRLAPSDRDLLKYGFENGLSNQFVIYEPGRFVGVNIDPDFKDLEIEQVAGRYSEGRVV